MLFQLFNFINKDTDYLLDNIIFLNVNSGDLKNSLQYFVFTKAVNDQIKLIPYYKSVISIMTKD